MSRGVNKINNLKKTDGFLQADFLKGFKYIDKAGEFMNAISTVDKIPVLSMSPEGLSVNLNDKIELRVSSYQLWMHFAEPVSFEEQRRDFFEKINLVNSLFEPEKYTRIGWRNYLVYENGNVLPQVIPAEILSGGVFNELVFTKNIADFDSRIKLSAVKNRESGNNGILFDIDIYKKLTISKGEDISRVIGSSFENIEKAFESEELLILINKMLV